MIWITECKNTECTGNPDKPEDGIATMPGGKKIRLDMSKVSMGHRKVCPYCECPEVFHTGIPDNAEDVGILRKEYNRRHMHEPGFTPSVEYIRDPNDPTKTIPKPVES